MKEYIHIMSDKNTDNASILMVFPYMPYPRHANGVAMRYLPLIRYLASRYVLELIVISDVDAGSEEIRALRTICRKVTVVPNPKNGRVGTLTKAATRLAALAPTTAPASYYVYGGESIPGSIAAAAGETRYRAVVWVTCEFTPYLFDTLKRVDAERVVVDFIDSPFLWARRRSERLSGWNLYERYERWKTGNWEAKLIRSVSAAVYISRTDAEMVRRDATPGIVRHVVPNGVSLESYTAARGNLPSPNMGFLGNMAYPPNIEAARWLYEEVYLPVRNEIPDLSLIVIGKDPVDSVRELGKRPGVVVTGTVADIWPYINSVDLFVFPLLIGAGLKNKILEAMGAGRPVITTAIGNEGIDAADGREIGICETSEEFRREAIRLLRSRELRSAMGESAQRFVRNRFSWGRILPLYEKIVLGHGIRRDRDSATA
jgi:polysaccharide biosynthesis protein PslH